MKILNTINGSIKKFAKGMFAIFTIKLLFFGIAFIVQSCQTDSVENFENTKKQIALNDFENILISNSRNVESFIKSDQLQLHMAKSSNNKITEISEQQAQQTVTHVIDGTKELLLNYGINEEDLVDVFGDSNDPKIAVLGLLTLRIEMLLNEKSNTDVSYASNLFFSYAYAQTTLQVVDCALTALGLPAGLVLGSAKNLGAKAILKAAGKLAGRAIGWIGMAVATYQFVRCLQNINPAHVAVDPSYWEVPEYLEPEIISPWDEGTPISLEDLQTL